MHLTRPKSSKGRSRPAASSSACADGGRGRTPVSPEPPADDRPDGSLRSRSQPIMCPASQPSRDEVPHMLRRVPAVPPPPPPSLNKYKVLPSIERRRSEASPGGSLDESMSKLALSDEDVPRRQRRRRRRRRQQQEEPQVPASAAHTCASEGDERADGPLGFRPKPPDPGPATAREAGGLLLAIRAPCGRRFQQHFAPTDTLLTVRASAEARYGARYGEASVETMDVPRRSFTDLDMTLAQCGVVNRSVLCISQRNDSEVEHD